MKLKHNFLSHCAFSILIMPLNVCNVMSLLCESQGVIHPVLKHLNIMVLHVTWTLMMLIKVPKSLWADAILSACHLVNRMPSFVYGQIPYCLLFPQKLLFSLSPRVFGYLCFVSNTRSNLDKLSLHSIRSMFVGYSCTQKGYCCFDPVSRKYYVSVDVTFFENTPFSLVSTTDL